MYQTLSTSHGCIIQVLIGLATGVVRRDIAERFMGETVSVGDIPSIEGMVSRELLKNWMFLCKVFPLPLEILSIPQE